MPNVERYGVLALSFLIVVILGVSLWGPEEQASAARIEAAPSPAGAGGLRESDPGLFPRPQDDPPRRATAEPPGQERPAPGGATGPDAAERRLGGTYYTVRSGDSLWKIARRHYGSAGSMALILAGNPGLTEKSRLQPGQKILLPHRETAAR